MEKIELNVKGVFYGLMAYWNKIDNATRYIVKLKIQTTTVETVRVSPNPKCLNTKQIKKKEMQEIACLEKDRLTYYHTFTGLAVISYEIINNCRYSTGKTYVVAVEAEDRDGKIIAKSDDISAEVITKT